MKYRAYPEYKDSGVEWLGSIPEHWELKRVKEAASLINGFPFDSKKFEADKGVPLVRIRDINSQKTVVGFIGDVPSESLIDNDDILIGMDGDFNVALWRGGEAALNQRVACVRADNYELQKFIFYLLPFNMKEINDLTYFTTVKHLSSVDILKTVFSLPPKSEIEQVVNFLNHETTKIDTLIEKQQELIKLLKEKRQAVISHAVTKGLNPNAPMKDSGIEWLGEVPEHWTCCSLKHKGRVIDCKHITAEFFDEGIPLASISEVKDWFVNLSTAKFTNEKYYSDLIGGGRKPQSGDIIYSRNATVGEAALVSEDMPDFAMGQDVCLIRLDEGICPEYVLYVLKSGVICQQLDLAMVGSTFKRINVDDIRNFSMALPSYDEQIFIVNELKRVAGKYDALVSIAETGIELMQERRTALISAAVTGKIDVRGLL